MFVSSGSCADAQQHCPCQHIACLVHVCDNDAHGTMFQMLVALPHSHHWCVRWCVLQKQALIAHQGSTCCRLYHVSPSLRSQRGILCVVPASGCFSSAESWAVGCATFTLVAAAACMSVDTLHMVTGCMTSDTHQSRLGRAGLAHACDPQM